MWVRYALTVDNNSVANRKCPSRRRTNQLRIQSHNSNWNVFQIRAHFSVVWTDIQNWKSKNCGWTTGIRIIMNFEHVTICQTASTRNDVHEFWNVFFHCNLAPAKQYFAHSLAICSLALGSVYCFSIGNSDFDHYFCDAVRCDNFYSSIFIIENGSCVFVTHLQSDLSIEMRWDHFPPKGVRIAARWQNEN